MSYVPETSVAAVQQTIVLGGKTKYSVQMVSVGIGDEGLPEIVVAHQRYYSFNAVCIQTVKNVVKQQYWPCSTACFAQEIVLSQFHGYQHSFVLSLTAFPAYGIAVYGHFQIVAMCAVQGISHGHVFMPVLLDNIYQRASLTMTCV